VLFAVTLFIVTIFGEQDPYLPEGWEILDQSYEIIELGGKKQDKSFMEQVNRNYLYNIALLYDQST